MGLGLVIWLLNRKFAAAEPWPAWYHVTRKASQKGSRLTQQVRMLLGAESAGPRGFCYVVYAFSRQTDWARLTLALCVCARANARQR